MDYQTNSHLNNNINDIMATVTITHLIITTTERRAHNFSWESVFNINKLKYYKLLDSLCLKGFRVLC
jgi:hypothetical protein